MENDRTYSRLYWKKGADHIQRLTGICTICGAEFMNGNPFAASYCPACAEKIKRKKAAERVRKHRERQKNK